MLLEYGLYLFEDVLVVDGNFDGWIVNQSHFTRTEHVGQSGLFQGLGELRDTWRMSC